MKNKKMMKTNYLIIGILSSLAIGVITGVLFAPERGCITRKKIAQKGNDLKNDIKEGIKENMDGIISSAENKYEEIASKVENIKNDLK